MPYISSAERFGMERGKLEIARHMLEDGMKLSVIERLTGFSSLKLKKLQQALKKTAKKNDH